MIDIMSALIAAQADDKPSVPPTPPGALAYTLREAFARYAAGNPFKPGDLVMPRKGYNIRGAGQPHVVLDVFEPVKQLPSEKGGMSSWADMRFVCEEGGEICTFIGESFRFEPYTGPVDDMGDASS